MSVPPIDLQKWALFLDVDGTLIDIAASPDAVVVPERLPLLLVDLRERLGGALALVTGRSIETVDVLLGDHGLPVGGIHGAEIRLPDGSLYGKAKNEALDRITDHLRAFVQTRPGLLVEDKGRAVAVHYRLAPELGDEVERHVRQLVETETTGLEIQPGKMVVEIRPEGADKGRAVEVFLEQAAFAGRCPLMIGDDYTDESAFRVSNSRGGRSIRVGRDERPTEATERLADPAEVLAWLIGLMAVEDIAPAG
jgi:trehalose 6-phosphate phosphatase